METQPITLFLLILVVLLTLLLLAFFKPSQIKLNKVKYQNALLGIKNDFERSQYQLVILNSDKLMDQALRGLRVRGLTMGERLKNSKNLKLNLNQVWQVHKLRNRVAHEVGFKVSRSDAQLAYNSTRDNLKKLNII